jgi:hypothetical protein
VSATNSIASTNRIALSRMRSRRTRLSLAVRGPKKMHRVGGSFVRPPD